MINVAVGLRNPYFSDTEKNWVWVHANMTLVQISPSSISLFFLILCIFPLSTYTCSFSGIYSFHFISFIHPFIHIMLACNGKQNQHLNCPQGANGIVQDTVPRKQTNTIQWNGVKKMLCWEPGMADM